MTKTTNSQTGKVNITGAETLKDTQAYPPAFGQAMYKLWSSAPEYVKGDQVDLDLLSDENYHEMNYDIAAMRNVIKYFDISATK